MTVELEAANTPGGRKNGVKREKGKESPLKVLARNTAEKW